ncbi:Xaa-Pro dipeptidyl-peptidase [Enterococcus sp. JM4C]|uniref:Xaa-Pro dipeptidyl-peptidase n=1 Tax=Candidatus Enterococcus huntleyi TaxID=1857217 RepID=UPI001379F9EA|nr:Xaa-Pro dipeptidyl-peptidase [Enterococcus sp. JM4C]KAF1295553.1 Xaa-Pro dipeptidyl-peptidase [Enterococcus sp. JM4C]
MKINQFSLKPTDYQTMLQELTLIGYYEEQETVTDQWFSFLSKSFPEVQESSGVIEKYKQLLATDQMSLVEYKESKQELTKEVFYTVALQLLQFQVGIDFQPATVLMDAEKIGVFIYDGAIETKEDLVKAWYYLANTHTKNGLSYLDLLASRGFYAKREVPKPLFFNGKAQAVFATDALIREVVYVEAPLDTDEDGQRDLLKVEILRPAETKEGLRVPSLFTASPYNQGTNPEAGVRVTHDVNVPLTRKEPNNLQYEDIQYQQTAQELPAERTVKGQATVATETFMREKSYALNDYFLARGFAAVYSAGIGTRDSDGIQTCGSVEQTIATTAIIEWLAGNRRAFTNRTDNIEISAWWSNQKVAMTGKSYLGTLATAAATTGVEGLETIISEAAISDWYQYYRDNGLVIAPGGYPGEDADVLAEETFSRMHDAGDYLKMKDFFNQKQKEMAVLQDRVTGDYNTFWDERNYLPNVKNIKADIVMVHGLNDWNVKPRHVADLWDALADVPVNKKLILHQGQHIYIHNMPSIDFNDMMNSWLSYKLYGIENQADQLLPNVLVQKNNVAQTWEPLDDWGSDQLETLYLGEDQLMTEKQTGTVRYSDQLAVDQFDAYTKNVAQWETDVKEESSPLTGHRYLAKTVPLEEEVTLDGRPVVKLKISSSVDFGMVSAQLVDYGEAKRLKEVPSILELKGLPLGYQWREDDLKEFQLGAVTPYKMITKGHINLQNRTSAWKTDELRADEFVEVEFALQPTLYDLPKGHKIGLILYGTDFGMTVRGNQEISYAIDLAGSQLQLPVQK